MSEEYEIAFIEKPEDEVWGILGRGLSRYNVRQAGDERFERLCYGLRSPTHEIVGGALGELYWGWFHLDLLWIDEAVRGQGYGHRLLTAIEAEARRRGAQHVFLDTFTFQAPDFYRQHGYQVFGELPDFPPGHRRVFMTKSL